MNSRSGSKHASTLNLTLIAAEIIDSNRKVNSASVTNLNNLSASATSPTNFNSNSQHTSHANSFARPPLVSFSDEYNTLHHSTHRSSKSNLKLQYNESATHQASSSLLRTVSGGGGNSKSERASCERDTILADYIHANNLQSESSINTRSTGMNKNALAVMKSLEFSTQESTMSAPANLTDLNAIEMGGSAAAEAANAKTRLLPLELPLSTSFASNMTYLTTSYTANGSRPHYMQQMSDSAALTTTKGLNKTRGSKAMRVMGNNGMVGTSGGTLKSSSTGAMSNKSIGSHFSRGMNAAKKVQQKRLFFKNGNINISRCNIDKRRRRYLTDIFTTLIDLKWRYNVLVFALGFLISWMIFATTWYGIAFLHGDLDPVNMNHVNYTSCVSGLHGFAGAILFSIETQQTIGYGARYTTEKCPEAIFVMMIQSSVGVMIQSFMVSSHIKF